MYLNGRERVIRANLTYVNSFGFQVAIFAVSVV